MVHYLRWSDGIMFTQIYLDTDDSDIEETILHELAHIAEHRYIMLKEEATGIATLWQRIQSFK